MHNGGSAHHRPRASGTWYGGEGLAEWIVTAPDGGQMMLQLAYFERETVRGEGQDGSPNACTCRQAQRCLLTAPRSTWSRPVAMTAGAS